LAPIVTSNPKKKFHVGRVKKCTNRTTYSKKYPRTQPLALPHGNLREREKKITNKCTCGIKTPGPNRATYSKKYPRTQPLAFPTETYMNRGKKNRCTCGI
jgi:hypothetical protein